MARGKSSGASLALWLALATLVVVLDQFTKWLILGHYQLGDATPVTGFFNLVRAHNTGAAFSFLAGGSGWQRWFFVALALAASGFIVWLLRQHAGQRLFSFSLAMILGGAVGNVIDRARFGAVVDFVHLHAAGYSWYVFNIADAAIVCGVGLLLLDALIRPQATVKA